jgi:acyl-CoA thioesterase FadM
MVDRISIEFPEKIHFSTDLHVRVGDINYANHLSHDRLITMIHEARMQFFEVLGLKEYEPNGVGIVIADLGIQYLKEAFYNNRLTIEIAAPLLEKKGVQLVYRVSRRVEGNVEGKYADEKEVIAIAKTGAVFFDYRIRRAVAAPEGLAALIDQREHVS